MIKDIILSFKENIKDKTTNPFLGTFLIVGVVRNWDFLVALVNLDLFTTLEEKKDILAPYFQLKTLLSGIWTNTWVTIIVIIGTFVLLSLSRLIINFFEKIVTPIVYQMTDKGTIVLKTDYKKLKQEKDKLEEKLEKERDSRLKIQAERDNLEGRILEVISKTSPTGSAESKDEQNSKIDLKKVENTVIESIYSMVENREMLELFKQVIDAIESGRSLTDDVEHVKYFIRLGLIKKTSSQGRGYSVYKFTDKGTELWNLLIEKNQI